MKGGPSLTDVRITYTNQARSSAGIFQLFVPGSAIFRFQSEFALFHHLPCEVVVDRAFVYVPDRLDFANDERPAIESPPAQTALTGTPAGRGGGCCSAHPMSSTAKAGKMEFRLIGSICLL